MSNYNNFENANQPQIDESAVDIGGDFEPGDEPWGGADGMPPDKQPEMRPKPIPPFRPFPVGQLPEPLASFVVNASESIGCDVVFILMPLLTAMGAAIGNSRRIQLKEGWTEPPIIWSVVIARSGAQKTPTLKIVKDIVNARQRILIEQNIENQKAYAIEKLKYETELARWKKKGDGDPPPEPEQKPWLQYMVDDITAEACVGLLADNYRGLVALKDELSAFFGGMGRYSNSASSDEAFWLSCFSSVDFTVNRKTGVKHQSVKDASISIAGCLTPSGAAMALTAARFGSGMVPRFLLSMPPTRVKKWTDAKISQQDIESVANIYNRLHSMIFDIGDGGIECPQVVELSPQAQKIWIQFYDDNAQEQAALNDERLEAAWSKLEAYCARIALIFHCCKYAADTTLSDTFEISERDISTAITVIEWFKNETKRVYALLEDQAQQEDCSQTVDLIRAKGGSITARGLMKMKQTKYKTAKAATAELDKLRDNGFGSWKQSEISPDGGTPSRSFVLFE